MYCKEIVPDVWKKKIFVFSAARFIISEWLMTRNYPDIITYVFCKKRVVTKTIIIIAIHSKGRIHTILPYIHFLSNEELKYTTKPAIHSNIHNIGHYFQLQFRLAEFLQNHPHYYHTFQRKNTDITVIHSKWRIHTYIFCQRKN
jgi:hypothetical protein